MADLGISLNQSKSISTYWIKVEQFYLSNEREKLCYAFNFMNFLNWNIQQILRMKMLLHIIK